MKYIKITLLLAIVASSTLHCFNPGDAAYGSSNQSELVLPSCKQMLEGSQYNHLSQLSAQQIPNTQESQDAALLLALARNPRSFAAQESANKQREVSTDSSLKSMPLVAIPASSSQQSQSAHANARDVAAPESASKRREVSGDKPPFTIPVIITTYQKPVQPAQEWVQVNRKSFSCPECSYTTHNKENLRSHKRVKHPTLACPH